MLDVLILSPGRPRPLSEARDMTGGWACCWRSSSSAEAWEGVHPPAPRGEGLAWSWRFIGKPRVAGIAACAALMEGRSDDMARPGQARW